MKSRKIMMTVPQSGRNAKEAVLTLSYLTILRTTLFSVSSGLILTVGTALYYRFDSVTGTHCRVPNYLPTISAAFRDLPSRFTWQLGILYHLPRAFLDIFLYHTYFSNRLNELGKSTIKYRSLNWFQSIVVFLHHFSLLTLTLVTSAPEHYAIHEAGFIGFMVTGFLHMLAFMWILRVTSSDGKGLTTMRRRVICFLFFAVTFAISMYLFLRHNAYCEPYMYTYYAGVEYLVVLSNMAFYYSVGDDFPDLKLVLIGAGHKHD